MPCRYLGTGVHWLITHTVVGIVIWGPCLGNAGLYECRASTGTPIYTDSPSQLERCQPVANSDTSRLGLVGGTSPSTPQAPEPIKSFSPPETSPPLSPYQDSATVAPP